MTGRRSRTIRTQDGEYQYVSRAQSGVKLDAANLYEKEQFMAGEKLIAIISDAASNGISLHSDRRVKNQRRRVHITLELTWSADMTIQQLGRTHRANQVNAPEYIILMSDLAGEGRFASALSKRIESLGALTHGDRRASGLEKLSQFNIDNEYGRDGLQNFCKKVFNANSAQLMGDETELELEEHSKLQELQKAIPTVDIVQSDEEMKISTFLNRIFGLPVDLQNHLFDCLMKEIQVAKRVGNYDFGVLGE